VAFHGKVVFEFFQNDDEDFKRKALKELCRNARKELNVSCTPVEEHLVENPERGSIAIALCAPSHESAKAQLNKLTEIFDGQAPARIVLEEFQESEIL
jgi:uncharacterized protein YlxP (DUF503 family)